MTKKKGNNDSSWLNRTVLMWWFSMLWSIIIFILWIFFSLFGGIVIIILLASMFLSALFTDNDKKNTTIKSTYIEEHYEKKLNNILQKIAWINQDEDKQMNWKMYVFFDWNNAYIITSKDLNYTLFWYNKKENEPCTVLQNSDSSNKETNCNINTIAQNIYFFPLLHLYNPVIASYWIPWLNTLTWTNNIYNIFKNYGKKKNIFEEVSDYKKIIQFDKFLQNKDITRFRWKWQITAIAWYSNYENIESADKEKGIQFNEANIDSYKYFWWNTKDRYPIEWNKYNILLTNNDCVGKFDKDNNIIYSWKGCNKDSIWIENKSKNSFINHGGYDFGVGRNAVANPFLWWSYYLGTYYNNKNNSITAQTLNLSNVGAELKYYKINIKDFLEDHSIEILDDKKTSILEDFTSWYQGLSSEIKNEKNNHDKRINFILSLYLYLNNKDWKIKKGTLEYKNLLKISTLDSRDNSEIKKILAPVSNLLMWNTTRYKYWIVQVNYNTLSKLNNYKKIKYIHLLQRIFHDDWHPLLNKYIINNEKLDILNNAFDKIKDKISAEIKKNNTDKTPNDIIKIKNQLENFKGNLNKIKKEKQDYIQKQNYTTWNKLKIKKEISGLIEKYNDNIKLIAVEYNINNNTNLILDNNSNNAQVGAGSNEIKTKIRHNISNINNVNINKNNNILSLNTEINKQISDSIKKNMKNFIINKEKIYDLSNINNEILKVDAELNSKEYKPLFVLNNYINQLKKELEQYNSKIEEKVSKNAKKNINTFSNYDTIQRLQQIETEVKKINHHIFPYISYGEVFNFSDSIWKGTGPHMHQELYSVFLDNKYVEADDLNKIYESTFTITKKEEYINNVVSIIEKNLLDPSQKTKNSLLFNYNSALAQYIEKSSLWFSHSNAVITEKNIQEKLWKIEYTHKYNIIEYPMIQIKGVYNPNSDFFVNLVWKKLVLKNGINIENEFNMLLWREFLNKLNIHNDYAQINIPKIPFLDWFNLNNGWNKTNQNSNPNTNEYINNIKSRLQNNGIPSYKFLNKNKNLTWLESNISIINQNTFKITNYFPNVLFDTTYYQGFNFIYPWYTTKQVENLRIKTPYAYSIFPFFYYYISDIKNNNYWKDAFTPYWKATVYNNFLFNGSWNIQNQIEDDYVFNISVNNVIGKMISDIKNTKKIQSTIKGENKMPEKEIIKSAYINNVMKPYFVNLFLLWRLTSSNTILKSSHFTIWWFILPYDSPLANADRYTAMSDNPYQILNMVWQWVDFINTFFVKTDDQIIKEIYDNDKTIKEKYDYKTFSDIIKNNKNNKNITNFNNYIWYNFLFDNKINITAEKLYNILLNKYESEINNDKIDKIINDWIVFKNWCLINKIDYSANKITDVQNCSNEDKNKIETIFNNNIFNNNTNIIKKIKIISYISKNLNDSDCNKIENTDIKKKCFWLLDNINNISYSVWQFAEIFYLQNINLEDYRTTTNSSLFWKIYNAYKNAFGKSKIILWWNIINDRSDFIKYFSESEKEFKELNNIIGTNFWWNAKNLAFFLWHIFHESWWRDWWYWWSWLSCYVDWWNNINISWKIYENWSTNYKQGIIKWLYAEQIGQQECYNKLTDWISNVDIYSNWYLFWNNYKFARPAILIRKRWNSFQVLWYYNNKRTSQWSVSSAIIPLQQLLWWNRQKLVIPNVYNINHLFNTYNMNGIGAVWWWQMSPAVIYHTKWINSYFNKLFATNKDKRTLKFKKWLLKDINNNKVFKFDLARFSILVSSWKYNYFFSKKLWKSNAETYNNLLSKNEDIYNNELFLSKYLYWYVWWDIWYITAVLYNYNKILWYYNKISSNSVNLFDRKKQFKLIYKIYNILGISANNYIITNEKVQSIIEK